MRHTEKAAVTRRRHTDAVAAAPSYGQFAMKGTCAVLWTLHGRVHTGSIEVHEDRLEFRARDRAVGIPLDSIAQFTIERGPAVRIHGLPVLSMFLLEGDVIRVASLEGTGVLHELAAVLAPPFSLRAVR